MKKWTFVLLLLVGAAVLGATALREPIASAAQSVSATIIGPLDAQGNVKVHEQGTAATRSANAEVSVHQIFQGQVNPFSCSVDRNEIYTVPAGTKLVVEYVGSRTDGLDVESAEASVYVENIGSVLPLVYEQQAAPRGVFVASESTHYTFPAGTSLELLADLVGATFCSVQISLGGYLQPAS